jgi:Ni/Co efflux regulator RcnB
MKITTIGCAAAALSLSLAGLAAAQGRDWHDQRDRAPSYSQRDDHGRADDRRHEQDRRDDRHDNNRYDGRHDDRHDDRGGYYSQSHDGRGAGPEHNFHRGERLPSYYHGRQFVVDDWRGHRLSAPPRGYHWVQTGAAYVLVGIATGIIAQVLLGNS